MEEAQAPGVVTKPVDYRPMVMTDDDEPER